MGKSIHNFHNFSFLFSEWIGKVYKLPKNSRFSIQKSFIFPHKIHVYKFLHLCYYVVGEDWRSFRSFILINEIIFYRSWIICPNDGLK